MIRIYPDDWETGTLGSYVLECNSGASLSPSDFQKSGMPVIPKKSIQRGGVVVFDDDREHCSHEYASVNSKSIVNSEYVITSLRDLVPSGPSIGLIGELKESGNFLLAQGVYGLRLKSKLDKSYLSQLSNQHWYRREMRQIMVGSTQVHIRIGEFLESTIPIPPLPEQKKIAEILSGIDKQIDLIRSQESKTHELLSAILQSAFSEPDLSPYSDISNSLAELEAQGKISLGRGDIISKIDIRERPGGHPIYSSSGKGDGKFGEYGEYMFDEELITWSIDGGGRLFHRSKHKFSVTNVCGYLRKMDDSIDYGYLHSALEYQHAKIKFDYSHKAHPSVIREIYRVALPPLERQLQIASTTASAKQQIVALANKRNTLTTLKSAVSSDLLSGRKRVSI